MSDYNNELQDNEIMIKGKKGAFIFIKNLYETLSYNDLTEMFCIELNGKHHFKHIHELNLHILFNSSDFKSSSILKNLFISTILRDGNLEELLTDPEVSDFIITTERAAISRSKASAFIADLRDLKSL